MWCQKKLFVWRLPVAYCLLLPVSSVLLSWWWWLLRYIYINPPVHLSPWNKACYVMFTMDHGSPSAIIVLYALLEHRSDSMWDTDYIANPFFLNYWTTIENLRWQLGGEIIQVTFGKSSTLLVQQLKKKFE